MPRHRFVLLVPFLLLGVAAPSLVAGQPAACLAAADLVGTPEFEASPRPDESAELLALSYTDGLVADDTLYNRIHQDLGLANLLFPDLDFWPVYRGAEPPAALHVEFVDETARDAAENGDNEAFNCLTELLDVSAVRYFQFTPVARVAFAGLYDFPTASSLFELIPEIVTTRPAAPYWVAFDTGCFHSPDGVSRVYFLEELLAFYPDAFTGNVERIEFGSDGAASVEEYDHRSNAPWQAELEACLDGQLSGDLQPGPIPPVATIPTLSEIGLAMLVLLVLAVGLVRLGRV